MSPASTLPPSRTKILAEAFAIPDPAPVMTATLPSNSPIAVLLVSVSSYQWVANTVTAIPQPCREAV
jgi:hypothetical protein